MPNVLFEAEAGAVGKNGNSLGRGGGGIATAGASSSPISRLRCELTRERDGLDQDPSVVRRVW